MSTHRTLLSILKTVEYSQTLSDVANRLFISQPYISKLLKETEQEYHVTLVTRAKPIELTDAGMTMINGLQAIVDEENQLSESLLAHVNQGNQPIHVAVTDPFLSDIVTDGLSRYYAAHPNQPINIKLLNDISLGNQIDTQNIDILVGKRLLDAHFKHIHVPDRELCLFSSSHCDGYDPDRLYQPFQYESFKALNTHSYIGFTGYDAFQRYVNQSFKKEDVNLTTAITVPTAADALRAVDTISGSTTVTTLYTAEKVFPDHDFNLMPLPANVLSLASTINYRDTTDDAIVNVAQYLRQLLSFQDNSMMV
ncbi:LysR family transcriptional regulator [Secundilactobacillus mixtipabuli]|uniref:LysR family transcriptional regulator n=1 Tax=Secundilactobacillus mixtipabuli TaxID=1435342 RepID=A0A1Z5ICC5_9LACO|nr:LysR family transcriptional regulator [Secundilactobacillus mixtipabuli]GAW99317.1 LysR family transcriptional regulator [Secundilactobacillus mixtipabuli]